MVKVLRGRKRMLYVLVVIALVILGSAGVAFASRVGYETAEYKVVESDGAFEIREYPDLMLVVTDSEMDTQGRDGSFMRLFRYISGENKADQKIAMTTPVFMEGAGEQSRVSMGFVMPKEVSAGGVPEPKRDGVVIRKRNGGRFAVIRFPGKLDSQLAKAQEAKLRQWMASKSLEAIQIPGQPSVEAAGYDPPFIPGLLRRNEVLIRLADTTEQ